MPSQNAAAKIARDKDAIARQSAAAAERAKAIVHAVTYFEDPAELVKASRITRGGAMSGLDVRRLEKDELLAGRGW